MNLEERRDLTAGVIAKFRDKPFDWSKRATCIHLARAQLVAFGYSPPPIPMFRTAIGAKRALRKTGHNSLVGLLDATLPGKRIAPARMLVGDLAVFPGEGMELIAVCAGGKMIGWHQDDDRGVRNIVVSLAHALGAWRL